MVYTYYELLWFFILYSFLGWCAGVAVSAVKRKTFVNTGVLSLPLCPVYGVGAVSYSVFLAGLKSTPGFLFVAGASMAAFLTVETGVVLERIFHRRWWDFSEHRFGFGGFITAPLLISFGGAALLVIYVGNPLILKVLGLMPRGAGRINLLCLLALAGVDLTGSLAAVWKWRRHVKRLAGVTENMQMVSASFGNAITRSIRRRLEKSYPNIETRRLLAAETARKEREEGGFARGCCFYKLACLFFLGAFLGDLVETVFCRFALGWWMSRSSVVYGPFSIVWGLGCVMLTAFLYQYRDKGLWYIFFYGTVAGGVYEYLCSVFTELAFGTVFWDYSGLPLNVGGRINLIFCFSWGIAAVIWLKVIYPVLSRWVEKIPRRVGPALTWLLIVLMAFNILISAMALGRYSARRQGAKPSNQVEELLDRRFPDGRMERLYPKAKFVGNIKE